MRSECLLTNFHGVKESRSDNPRGGNAPKPGEGEAARRLTQAPRLRDPRDEGHLGLRGLKVAAPRNSHTAAVLH